MLRLWTIALFSASLLMMHPSDAAAVSKKSKADAAKQRAADTTRSSSPKQTTQQGKQSRPPQRSIPAKRPAFDSLRASSLGALKGVPLRFNDFLDANNNGIDDRLEAMQRKGVRQEDKRKQPLPASAPPSREAKKSPQTGAPDGKKSDARSDKEAKSSESRPSKPEKKK